MSKSLKNLVKPQPIIDEQILTDAGFINSGKSKYQEMIKAFSETLFEKSVLVCEANNHEGEREVTGEHVNRATHIIYGKTIDKPDKWSLIVQIIELIITAFAGVGASNLKDTWGALLFGACLALAVMIFVVRNVVLKR
jgi:hypothetical protein